MRLKAGSKLLFVSLGLALPTAKCQLLLLTIPRCERPCVFGHMGCPHPMQSESVMLSKREEAERPRAPSKHPEDVSSAMPIRGVLPRTFALRFLAYGMAPRKEDRVDPGVEVF